MEELTAKANAWPSVEWKVIPPAASVLLPAFRAELVRVRSVEVGPSVHSVDAVGDGSPLGHEHRRPSIGATTHGERGVLGCGAEVQGDRWHKTEDLVKHVAQVRDVLQLGMSDFALWVLAVSEFIDDCLTQTVPHLGTAREEEERRAEEASSSVTTGKEDVEHIVSEHLRVVVIRSQGLGEDVSARLLTLGVVLAFNCEPHVVIDHFVDAGGGVLELLRVDHPVEFHRPRTRGQIVLSGVECLGESLGSTDGRFLQYAAAHGVDGFSEEEVRGGVDGQKEEEVLNIKGRPVFRDELNQTGDMAVH